jgi:glycerate kinase
MKILLAPDKFKGSLSAEEVCKAIEKGLNGGEKTFEIITHPMADGGDGSLAVLSAYLNLKKQAVETFDPIGREVSAAYYTSSKAAFIEVASASGLVLLNEQERNPLKTSTLGTGKMIADAISKGYQEIYLFLGGSATNDGGMGIALALGSQFLDEQKRILKPIGANLSDVKYIESSPDFDLEKIKITLLCDVTNPLFGINGAAYVYAPQKGAKDEQVRYLDNGLSHFSNIIHQKTGIDVSNIPGSGAAGGIGAGLIGLFGAKIEKGFDTISKLTDLEKYIQWADWVVSGEGKLDSQSLQGKVIDGVALLCKKYDKPLALFVGKNDLQPQDLHDLKAKHVFSISENAKNLEDAMLNGAVYLEEMAVQFRRLLH